MTHRLQEVMRMNPDFAEALRKNESWAVKQAEAIKGIDGQASRRFPERAFKEDGHTRRNWCGTCAHKDGCVSCDLPGNYKLMKGSIGIFED